ncbi:retron system putative HNH endonuclease [Pseudomonas protegens]|uniref:retron system putative HNH endonuclease n=1 Tax=Pseudomonas protegens TaxID=380021 RepID=UPI00275D764E|nr:retron system putative HNH endonuclease [Pseudomonas protegens]MDP9504069.1 retron system putative HNH endonuclease [Pseudomonas protegens]
MKQIFKGTEPASFTEWKASINEDWTPSYSTLQNPQKHELHSSLLNEQGHFCCYCGRDIDHSTSHIEHFRPQEHFEELELDYQNLHASCIRETRPGAPLHCGHIKGSWFDETKHISPMENDCERRFRYLLTGQIQAADSTDRAAEKMIEVLALDIAYLNNRRQSTIEHVFDSKFIAQVSTDDLRLIIHELRTTPIIEQQAFDHVVARYAEQLLGL